MEKILLQAIDCLGVTCEIKNNLLQLSNGVKLIQKEKELYVAEYISSNRIAQKFLIDLEKEYDLLVLKYLEELKQKKLALERQKMNIEIVNQQQIEQEILDLKKEEKITLKQKKREEKARKAYIQQKIEQLQEKAEAKGYIVQRQKVGNKVKLVLRRG